MKYTLGTASQATGKAKSTILRSIKSGTISAKKVGSSYEIDPAELHRVFPRTVAENTTSNVTQPDEEHHETLRFRLEILERERERERAQMQDTIDDLRARLDRSDDRITALLNAPTPAKRRWWPWQ